MDLDREITHETLTLVAHHQRYRRYPPLVPVPD
jgi:hypothetical protein